MTEKKRSIPKKENMPENHIENEQIDSPMMYQHPEQIDIPYSRLSDMPYNDYRLNEKIYPNENYQGSYNYDLQRMYEYDQSKVAEESSSEETEKKTRKTGRKKISMEYIQGKNKRSVTFSKRKKGIMKKAYELNVLTGTQILLLVASESGHVYTFATPKLKPIISNHERLIQQCLNTPSTPPERKNVQGYYGSEEEKKDKYYPGYNDYYGNYENPE